MHGLICSARGARSRNLKARLCTSKLDSCARAGMRERLSSIGEGHDGRLTIKFQHLRVCSSRFRAVFSCVESDAFRVASWASCSSCDSTACMSVLVCACCCRCASALFTRCVCTAQRDAVRNSPSLWWLLSSCLHDMQQPSHDLCTRIAVSHLQKRYSPVHAGCSGHVTDAGPGLALWWWSAL